MITVYLVNTLLLSKVCLCLCKTLLSKKEKQRILKLRQEDDRRSYLVAHALLRCVLSFLIDIEPGRLCFKHSTNGKPFLLFPDYNVSFNISHSGYYVAIAAAKTNIEIGIDIQQYDNIQWPQHFSSFILGEHELKRLGNNTCQIEIQRCLTQYWTIKEAYLKGKGSGLINDEISANFQWASLRGTNKSAIYTWNKNPSFFAALATMTLDRSVKIRRLEESAAEELIMNHGKTTRSIII